MSDDDRKENRPGASEAERRVLERYPQAVWFQFYTNYGRVVDRETKALLGTGPTEQAAWDDADRRLT